MPIVQVIDSLTGYRYTHYELENPVITEDGKFIVPHSEDIPEKYWDEIVGAKRICWSEKIND